MSVLSFYFSRHSLIRKIRKTDVENKKNMEELAISDLSSHQVFKCFTFQVRRTELFHVFEISDLMSLILEKMST